jgi:hypothetical protein
MEELLGPNLTKRIPKGSCLLWVAPIATKRPWNTQELTVRPKGVKFTLSDYPDNVIFQSP